MHSQNNNKNNNKKKKKGMRCIDDQSGLADNRHMVNSFNNHAQEDKVACMPSFFCMCNVKK